MPLRRARVTCRDGDGNTHAVELTAASVYEAAALGVAAFKQGGWLQDFPADATLIVTVIPPPVEHRVTLGTPCRRVVDLYINRTAADVPAHQR